MPRPTWTFDRVPLPVPPPTADPTALVVRPRERLASDGEAHVTDAELVALVLGTGVAGRPVLEVAEAAIDEAGGLAELARASPAELTQVAGIGPARAARLAAAFALGLRVVARRVRNRPLVGSPAEVYARVWPRLAGLEQEVFLAIGIDVRNGLVCEVEIGRGTLVGVEVHPREVFRPLVKRAAAALIVVHNHPSGDPTPSPEDYGVTERLRAAGELMGVPLVDHIVCAAEGWRSIAEAMGGPPPIPDDAA